MIFFISINQIYHTYIIISSRFSTLIIQFFFFCEFLNLFTLSSSFAGPIHDYSGTYPSRVSRLKYQRLYLRPLLRFPGVTYEIENLFELFQRGIHVVGRRERRRFLETTQPQLRPGKLPFHVGLTLYKKNIRSTITIG